LAAAGGIEHGAVEPDAAFIGRNDASSTASGICIVAEKQFGHSRSQSTVIPGRPAGASPESIFQWPVFLDFGLAAGPRPGMTGEVAFSPPAIAGSAGCVPSGRRG